MEQKVLRICKSFVKKIQTQREIEFAPVYFNSTAKTVTNHRFRLENLSQEILHMTDAWINK